MSATEYQNAFSDLAADYLPTDISVRVRNNQDRYDLTFERNTKGVVYSARHRMPDAAFKAEDKRLRAQGFELKIHQPYRVNGSLVHVAVWVETADAAMGNIWASSQEIPLTGKGHRLGKPIDQMLVNFLAKHQIAGATMAIGYRGKIIYERGVGFSDIENRIAMNADARLRIASISKPLTGAAILKLIDQKKLSFNDRVFDRLKIQPVKNQTRIKAPDPRLKNVTVLQLLRHTGGWDRGVSFDPMFRQRIVAKFVGKPTPVPPTDIIRYMMTQPLDHDPGTKYAYSNYGYSLLGRLIEEVSGMDYESYVKQEILKPLKIKSMQIGKTRLSERTAREPLYYTQQGKKTASLFPPHPRVAYPYGAWYLESFDSHGGWISSASDLVRFANAFENPNRCRLMSATAVNSMFIPPGVQIGSPANGNQRFYGCGWSIVVLQDGQRYNAYHSGLFSGTSGMLVRRHDGYTWAILFNTDRTKGNKVAASAIDGEIHRAVDAARRLGRFE